MFKKAFWIFLIIMGYVYMTSNDKEKDLYKKAKTVYNKYYKDIKKDFDKSDLKIKVQKISTREKRFF